MEVNGQLLESGADAAALLEPADALLDHVPLTIGLLIEGHGRVVWAFSLSLCGITGSMPRSLSQSRMRLTL